MPEDGPEVKTSGIPEMHPIAVKAPWYMVGIDFIGPLSPASEDGSKYMHAYLRSVTISQSGLKYYPPRRKRLLQ